MKKAKLKYRELERSKLPVMNAFPSKHHLIDKWIKLSSPKKKLAVIECSVGSPSAKASWARNKQKASKPETRSIF